MIHRPTSRYPDDTETPGFTLHRIYSFRDGDMVSSEILLPVDRATVAYVKGLRAQAETTQDLYREEMMQDTDLQSKNKTERSVPRKNTNLLTDEATVQDHPECDLSEPSLTQHGRISQQVPCIHHDDVISQQKAAESNSKYSERDRTNAVKAVTKALLARPMTRRVGGLQDVHSAMQKLRDLAPHVPELVEALKVPLLVAAVTGAPPMMQPILLVGAPGVGKSHIALQIADLLGVPLHTVSYAASGAAGNVLSGADKNWSNSSTGIVFNALAEGEFANPVICLDEIDKASLSSAMSGPDRNPLNELLALLEPITACVHKDRCAEIRVDARHIVWVATANSLTGLSPALLSRFQIIVVRKPDARAAVSIALSVTQMVSTQMGATVKPPSGEVLQFLATLTPRTMRRIWTGAAGRATAAGRERVTMNDIEQSVGINADQNRLH